MDDKRMEGMLRESWSSEPPDGMRERVLRRARAELSRATRPAIFQWKPLLATLAIIVVLVTNVSDHCRQSRMTAMMGGESLKITAPLDPASLLLQRRAVEGLLAQVPTDGGFGNSSEGDDDSL